MAKDPTLAEQRRQFYNVVFAITQWFAPFFHKVTGIGRDITFASRFHSPEAPAPFAYSIWYFIFTLSIIYAIYQAFPKYRDDPLLKKIRFFSCLAFISSTLWMLLYQIFGNGWWLAILMALLLFGSVVAYVRTLDAHLPLKSLRYWVIIPLFGLLSGWSSLAAFVNFASIVKDSPAGLLGLTPTWFGTITLSAAFLFSLFIIYLTKGNVWYIAAFLWGLAALFIANIFTEFNLFMAALIGLFFLIITYLGVWLNRDQFMNKEEN